MDQRTWWWMRVMARLKPGDSIDRATAALRGVQPQMREATIPTNYRPKDLPRLSEGSVQRCAPAANGPNGLGAPVPGSAATSSWRSSRWCC